MRTSIYGNVGLGAVVAVGLLAGAQTASAQGYANLSCGQLWYERNAIYAQYGHCFQTAQAISAFGRACFPPYGRLPPSAQARVNAIISWEPAREVAGLRRQECHELAIDVVVDEIDQRRDVLAARDRA